MSFGTIFQLVGALIGIIWALVTGQYWVAGWILLHVTGDGIVGFLKPLQALIDFENGTAKQYVKLRPFLLFVGLMLMNIGKFAHVNFRIGLLLFHIPVTSNGLFLLGESLALIGAFTYKRIYT